jgi:hypothetical protein
MNSKRGGRRKIRSVLLLFLFFPKFEKDNGERDSP